MSITFYMLWTPSIVIITMNFNLLGSYCSPVLIPYSTFVYRASRLKRAPCLIFFNPCIVINVI